MNRNDFQRLAEVRINEAQALVDAGYFDGAYYLSGYAVECALKACIARQTREFDFPDRNLVNQIYVHDLAKLVSAAGLQVELQTATGADPGLEANWAIVKDWSEEARYARYDKDAARAIVDAVADPTSGVLRWLKFHW